MACVNMVLGLVICTTVDVSTQAVTDSDSCSRFLAFSDTVGRIPKGKVWDERCRTCRCEDRQVTCTLNEGVVCDKPYDPSYDTYCLKWSDDECCCEEIGCSVNGTNYHFGEYYPLEPGKPCTMWCKCVAYGMQTCVLDMNCGDTPLTFEQEKQGIVY